jgi:hypothetical protein
MMMRCRFSRSAAAPPIAASTNTGICPANDTKPRSADDRVSRSTSHDCAICCIQVPVSEIS